ncbi:hypothetical protein C5167_017821 [Papaver somniferum]|uniref:Glycosyltransferase n=1 Tax=Papaver somniferum TaxID=3469 RepID=A0A4Y7IPH9_PAPSO|nr:hypothetical protein C5167_017821 [Papaver somniferum]
MTDSSSVKFVIKVSNPNSSWSLGGDDSHKRKPSRNKDSEGETNLEKKRDKKLRPAFKIDTTVDLPKISFNEDVTIPLKGINAPVSENVSAFVNDPTVLTLENVTASSKHIITTSPVGITMYTSPSTMVTSSSLDTNSVNEGVLDGTGSGDKLLLEIINAARLSTEDPSRSRVCDALAKLLCESSPDKATRREIFELFLEISVSHTFKCAVGSAACESDEMANMLKMELVSVTDKNAELKKQVRKLTEKLRLSERRKDQAQKKLLKKVALRNELIVAVANSKVKEMLEVWFINIKRVGILNYLVVALDDSIASFCKLNDVPVYKRNSDESFDEIARTGSKHAVSGLKFHVLREFLQLGYSVLLSDVDIVYLQDPFDHIYRDSDVESMTDGHDNMTAYGYNDVFDEPSMGWGRYAHTMRVWVFNTGFLYVRPTIPAIELLDRVADRLAKENAWDQAVFNEELFYPSCPGYEGLHASKRVMDYYNFMNSKILFKTVRKDEKLRKLKPVIVHVNYHPDKLPRMKEVVDFYVNGNQDALRAFPDGSE